VATIRVSRETYQELLALKQGNSTMDDVIRGLHTLAFYAPSSILTRVFPAGIPVSSTKGRDPHEKP